MKKCKNKYENGGALDTIIPMVPGILSAINPALGAVAGVGLNAYQQSKQSVPQSSPVVNSNPYGFELGGQLIGQEGAEMYKGVSHSDPSGGISVDPNGNIVPDSNQKVEGEEVSYKTRGGKTYIFSASLKIK